jgi:hypothetical protein
MPPGALSASQFAWSAAGDAPRAIGGAPIGEDERAAGSGPDAVSLLSVGRIKWKPLLSAGEYVAIGRDERRSGVTAEPMEHV